MSFASIDSISDKIKKDPNVASLYAFNYDSGSHDMTKMTKSNWTFIEFINFNPWNRRNWAFVLYH